MIHEWLCCPSCGKGGDHISITVDNEHLTVRCDHCATVLSQYHGDGLIDLNVDERPIAPLYGEDDG